MEILNGRRPAVKAGPSKERAEFTDFAPGRRKNSKGFAALPHELRKDERLKDKAVLLAAALLEYARDKAVCWPSNATLARDLRCKSTRTVQLALAALRDSGWVRVELGVTSNPTGRLIHLAWREADCAPLPRLDAPEPASRVAPEFPSGKNGKEKERPSSTSPVRGTPPAGQVRRTTVEPPAPSELELIAWAEGKDPILQRIARAALGWVDASAEPASVARNGVRAALETIGSPRPTVDLPNVAAAPG